MAHEHELSFRERFGCGMIGAVAPEIVRWYHLMTKGADLQLPHNLLISAAILVVFVLLSATFVATVWQENNRFKNFYLGASFPFVVTALVGTH